MKFRKKPVVIEAIQWNGINLEELKWFMKDKFNGTVVSEVTFELGIPTLEGTMTASLGDWIIKGVAGEFYPCKPDIFVATYEPKEPQQTEQETLGAWTPCPKCGGMDLGCDNAMPLGDEHGNAAVRLSFCCRKCGHEWHELFGVRRIKEGELH